MGINVLPKNNGVALKGELFSLYTPYDTDQDGAISPVEASKMDDGALQLLLSDIIAPKNDPENNNHKAFIGALPPATIARFFQKEIHNEMRPLPDHIYGDFAIENPSNIAAVMYILILADALDDADAFLKHLPAPEWKNVFMGLTMLDPANAAVRDYVSSRTKLDYAALQMRGGYFFEADKDKNGLLDAVEVKGMENLKTFPNPDLFKAASTSSKGHIPFHYLFEEMNPLLNQVLIGHAASGARLEPDSNQNIDFLNNLAFHNTEKFVAYFDEMEKVVGPERRGQTILALLDYLDEKTRREVVEKWGERFVKRIDFTALSSGTPFVIEGLTSVDEASFEKEVKAPLIPVLLVFGADWCGSCHQSIPTVKALAKEFEGRIKVVVVDYDRNMKLAQKLGVDKFPTFILLQRGNEMKRGRMEGFNPQQLRHLLETNAPKIEKI